MCSRSRGVFSRRTLISAAVTPVSGIQRQKCPVNPPCDTQRDLLDTLRASRCVLNRRYRLRPLLNRRYQHHKQRHSRFSRRLPNRRWLYHRLRPLPNRRYCHHKLWLPRTSRKHLPGRYRHTYSPQTKPQNFLKHRPQTSHKHLPGPFLHTSTPRTIPQTILSRESERNHYSLFSRYLLNRRYLSQESERQGPAGC